MTAWRRRRVPAAGTPALAAVLLAAGLTASCGTNAAEIIGAFGEPGSRDLELNIDSCNAPNIRADVDEAGDAISILVETDDAGGDECADTTWITLEDVLGSRQVIDRSTGRPVEVSAPDG